MATTNLQTALLVLAIGMITVFIVLGLVVLSGRLLIRIVNSLHADTAPLANNSAAISSAHIAAITAAVTHVTEGKASIVKIEKE